VKSILSLTFKGKEEMISKGRSYREQRNSLERGKTLRQSQNWLKKLSIPLEFSGC